jgi:hypothetical protein
MQVGKAAPCIHFSKTAKTACIGSSFATVLPIKHNCC